MCQDQTETYKNWFQLEYLNRLRIMYFKSQNEVNGSQITLYFYLSKTGLNIIEVKYPALIKQNDFYFVMGKSEFSFNFMTQMQY